MSQSVQIGTQQAADSAVSPQNPSGGGLLVERRIDSAHTAVPAPVLGQGIAPPRKTHDGNDGQAAAETRRSTQQESLIHASRIVEEIRDELEDLDRREQALSAQLSLLDQERRNVRLWVQQIEQEAQEWEGRLRDQERQLAETAAANHEHEVRLQRMRDELAADREHLEAERRSLKAEIDAELREQRSVLEQARNELEAERSTLREQITEEAISAELRASCEAFQIEREEWIGRRDAEIAQLSQQRAQWDAQKRSEEALLRQKREEHERALNQTWSALEQERRAWIEEKERQRVEAEEARQTARRQLEQEIAAERAQIQREKAMLEKRLRFQEEHLAKTRRELEAGRHEFEQETQRFRQESSHTRETQRARRTQLDHYRALLAERESSLDREHQILERERRLHDASLNEEKKRLVAERETWDHERCAQQAELRRQQDMLALHAENLEARRERLDSLRAELEDTHRNTLEMRMAVEEAWAQLAQAAGEERAKHRVDVARAALSEHFQTLRDNLVNQRRELELAQSRFQDERDKFRDERQMLTDWISERDERLRLREQVLSQDAQDLENRQSSLHTKHQQWLKERHEAELIIRNLLDQLADVNDTP